MRHSSEIGGRHSSNYKAENAQGNSENDIERKKASLLKDRKTDQDLPSDVYNVTSLSGAIINEEEDKEDILGAHK